MDPTFAICLWNLAPTEATIASLRSSGVTALEPGAAFLTQHGAAAIAAVGEWCRAAGIHVYVCHVPFGGPNDISLLDEDARQQAVASIKESLVRAASMGAECAVIHPSGAVQAEVREHHRAQLLRSLETLIRSAERTGIRLALENMLPDHLGDTGAEVRDIVDGFGSHWLGVCYDTGHAHLNPEGVAVAFGTLYDRVITFHLQDNDGNHDRHLQPPYGTIDWGQFASMCRADDFPFPWSVETPAWNGAGWEVMLREMGALLAGALLTVPLNGEPVHVVCQRCGRYCFGSAEDWFCGCSR